MKKLISNLSVFLLFAQVVFAQDPIQESLDVPAEAQDSDKTIPLQVIEEIPVYPGCEDLDKSLQMKCFNDKVMRHIQNNLVYPNEFEELGMTVRVIVMFIIDKEGVVTVTKSKSIQPGAQIFEEEARKVIQKLPKMKPGIQKGKPVIVSYNIPITFMTVE